jgi:hypothetical protein
MSIFSTDGNWVPLKSPPRQMHMKTIASDLEQFLTHRVNATDDTPISPIKVRPPSSTTTKSPSKGKVTKPKRRKKEEHGPGPVIFHGEESSTTSPIMTLPSPMLLQAELSPPRLFGQETYREETYREVYSHEYSLQRTSESLRFNYGQECNEQLEIEICNMDSLDDFR